MNFDLTEKEKSFINKIDELMKTFARGKNLETKDEKSSENILRELLPRLGEIFYLEMELRDPVQSEFGCNDKVCFIKAMETLAGYSQSVFLSVEMSTRMFGSVLATWGNDRQKEKWLDPLIKGNLLGALALSEDTMNIESDPLKTHGREERGTIFVSGSKSYVINGPIADVIAVVGNFDDRPAFFIVEKDSTGLSIGERLNTLGYDGTVISGLQLMDCVVAEDQIIGPFREKNILNKMKLWENQILIGASLGMMKSSFEAAKAYAKTHTAGGKPIIAYQEVAFKLAEMLTLYQTSQLLGYKAVWTASVDPKAAESLIWCAKVFCTESAEKISSEALKVLAREGYFTDNDTELAYRCAKYAQIAGTSTEIARVKIGDDAMAFVHGRV